MATVPLHTPSSSAATAVAAFASRFHTLVNPTLAAASPASSASAATAPGPVTGTAASFSRPSAPAHSHASAPCLPSVSSAPALSSRLSTAGASAGAVPSCRASGSFLSLTTAAPSVNSSRSATSLAAGNAPSGARGQMAMHAQRPGSPPPNARLFLGNLACEKVSKESLRSIFGKHGNVIDVSLHSSFGFVQFDSAECAARAIAAENRRVIAGLTLDISLATNRGEPRSRGGRGRGRRGRGRDAGPPFDEQSGPPPFAGGAYGDAPQPPPARDAFDRRDRGRERGGRGRDRDYDRAGGGGYGGRDRSPARGSGRPSARTPPMDVPPARPKVPDCVILIVGKRPETRAFADALGVPLAETGLHVDSVVPRAGERIQDLLDTMKRDGIAFVCVLLDTAGARQTVDVHGFRSPTPQFHPDLFLSEAVAIIEKEWRAPTAPAPRPRSPGAHRRPDYGAPRSPAYESRTPSHDNRFRAGGPPPAAREVGHAYRDPSPDPRGPRQPHYGAPDRDPRGGAAPPPAAAGSAATGSGGYYPGSVAPPPAAAPPAAAPWAGRYDAPPPAGAGRYDGYAPAEAGGGGGSYRRGPSAERGAPPAQAMPSAYERHGPPGDGSYPGGRAEGGVPPAPAYGWRGEAPPPAAAPDRYAGGQYAPPPGAPSAPPAGREGGEGGYYGGGVLATSGPPGGYEPQAAARDPRAPPRDQRQAPAAPPPADAPRAQQLTSKIWNILSEATPQSQASNPDPRLQMYRNPAPPPQAPAVSASHAYPSSQPSSNYALHAPPGAQMYHGNPGQGGPAMHPLLPPPPHRPPHMSGALPPANFAGGPPRPPMMPPPMPSGSNGAGAGSGYDPRGRPPMGPNMSKLDVQKALDALLGSGGAQFRG